MAGALYFLGLIRGVFRVVPVVDLPDYLPDYNERLALGYVGFRLVAAVLIVIGVILLLLLLTLSQEFIKAGVPASSHFQTIGEILRTGRDLLNHGGMILVLSMGSLLLMEQTLSPRMPN